MASNEDCEAIDILIIERRQAIAAELEKQIKKEKDPIIIKEEIKQMVCVAILVLLKQQTNK